jgi:hypothetical protein
LQEGVTLSACSVGEDQGEERSPLRDEPLVGASLLLSFSSEIASYLFLQHSFRETREEFEKITNRFQQDFFKTSFISQNNFQRFTKIKVLVYSLKEEKKRRICYKTIRAK